jgi:hypothetical protein
MEEGTLGWTLREVRDEPEEADKSEGVEDGVPRGMQRLGNSLVDTALRPRLTQGQEQRDQLWFFLLDPWPLILTAGGRQQTPCFWFSRIW